jgi:hypothetical protein
VNPAISTVLKVEPLGSAAVQAVVHSHGAELRPFRVMLQVLGKPAARHIQLLRAALTIRSSRLTQSALTRGWQAAASLAEQLKTIAPSPERTLLEHELEQSLASLLSRDRDFIENYTEAIADVVRAGLARKEARALAALGKSVQPSSAAQVIARLAKNLQTASPELIELWERIYAVKQAHAGIERAAAIAAARATVMRRLLSAGETERLWSHLFKVRGELGEALALHAPEWLVRREQELDRARRLAYRMGPGHQAVYLTQAENGLRLNRAEGPDALVAIINRRERRIFDVARGQVKVALESEGAIQHVNDIFRRVGLERNRTLSSAFYEFPLTPGGQPQIFVAAAHPDVTTRLYLMNAAGGHTAPADLELLRTFGMAVDEIGMGWTVNQLTHGAISLAESAIGLLKRP